MVSGCIFSGVEHGGKIVDVMNSKDLRQGLRAVGGGRRNCLRWGGSRRRGARRGRNTVIGASAWCICQRGGEEVVVSGLLSELDRMIVGNQGGKGGGEAHVTMRHGQRRRQTGVVVFAHRGRNQECLSGSLGALQGIQGPYKALNGLIKPSKPYEAFKGLIPPSGALQGPQDA